MTESAPLDVDIVVPTIGRASLAELLRSIAGSRGPLPRSVTLVDDRRDRSVPLDIGVDPGPFRDLVRIVAGAAAGPAAARNAGWRRGDAGWVAFVDDDVRVSDDWLEALERDLAACAPRDGASQGQLHVPLPAGRRPTDWERNVAGLEHSRWITADCAYRRRVLDETGGFDPRFPRAYREDADIALRAVARGWTIAQGARQAFHPVRPADPWISVRLQAGNADDALMTALHGAGWYERAGAPRGQFAQHLVVTGAAMVAAVSAAIWAGATLAFAWRRIAPGPRTPREVGTMLATSAAIPFAAVYHRLRGRLRARRLVRREPLPAAVLFDRDGTLVEDVPYNRDPAAVRVVPGARAAIDRLRRAGVATGVVTNQSGIAEGRLSREQFDAVNARIESLLGPLGPWFVCEHATDAGCSCRKPQSGLILDAARTFGLDPSACVVIGDIGSDVDAALAAGARPILVPTAVTRREEVERAPVVAHDLAEAIELVLHGTR